jgi:hypothetical protein
MHRRPGGWRSDHPHAVVVDRRSAWGNPFVVGTHGVPDAATAAELFRSAVLLSAWAEARVKAEPSMLLPLFMETMPGAVPRLDAIRERLAGRDLACWCPLDAPCHADVLLELANGAAAMAAPRCAGLDGEGGS